MAKLDILIPVYNTARYLDQCIESLQRQSFSDWHAIIVDDSSTDGESPKCCDKWAKKDDRIEVYHLTENKGVSYVRQFLINRSSAPLVGWVDSDDYVGPDHFKSLVDVLNDNSVDIALCGLIKVYQNSNKYETFGLLKECQSFAQPLLFILNYADNILSSHLCTKVFRRTLFDDLSFPFFQHYEDYAVLPKIMARAKMAKHTGKATYFYRQHDTSVVHTIDPQHLFDFFQAHLCRMDTVKRTDFLSERQKKMMSLWDKKFFEMIYHKFEDLPDSPQKRVLFAELKDIFRKFNYKALPFPFYLVRKLRYLLIKNYHMRVIYNLYGIKKETIQISS